MTKAAYLWLLVPALGIGELGMHVFFAHRAPTREQWLAVRPEVASSYRPGDVVVVAPYWAEPMARWTFGDELMPPRDVARPDTSRYGKAIEVSILGSHSPELTGWKLVGETKKGSFTLRTLANPIPPTVTYDFVDHLGSSSADVRIDRGPEPTRCSFTTTATVEGGGLGGPPTYPSSRFVCAGQPTHVFVGVTIIDDEQVHPRRCIWSHPPGGDQEIVTRFHDVPLGTQLHGHVGMGWYEERGLGVPKFNVRIVAAGIEVGTIVHQAGDFWKAFELPLGGAAGVTGDVEFYVSSPGAGTHVCFEADSR